MWPGTYLRLEGAATWRVLRPGGVRLVNHHCERQPRLAAILAAHICKSNKRNATPISTNMKQSEGDVNLTSQWRMHVSICSMYTTAASSSTGALQHGTVSRSTPSQTLYGMLLGCYYVRKLYYTIQ